jgi:hypothetical protein
MSAQTEIENLRTLQQSLSDLVEDYNEMAPKIEAVDNITKELSNGKQLIAQAISDKGVPATADESLSELAEKVSEIDWNPNVGFTFMDGYAPKTLVEYLNGYYKNLLSVNDYQITTDLKYGAFFNCTNVTSIILNDFQVPTLDSRLTQSIFYGNTNLRYVKLSKITNINNGQAWDGSGSAGIQTLYDINFEVPNCSYFATTLLGRNNNRIFSSLTFGKLTTFNISSLGGAQYLLRNITVGNGTDITLNLSLWDALDVIAEGQSGIDELNSNIQNNLVANLKDNTGLTAKTVTFGQNLRNVLTAETEQMFADKNWNIAPAKTV